MLPRVHNSHSLSTVNSSHIPVFYHLPHPIQQISQMDRDPPPQYHPNSCINPHLPAGSDPNSIDFRTFYPYTPNEVKHRKRTSRAQLKVLEDHFRRDTKPNAALRKILAEQLDMSVRGVQVWFQNRRAKEKALATKMLCSRKSTATPKLGPSSPSEETESLQDDSPISSADLELIPESPSDSHQSSRSASNPPDFDSPSQFSRPTPPHRLSIDSANTSWHSHSHSPSPEECGFTPQFSEANDLLHLRRGSLPAYTQYGPPSLDDFDPTVRRRSVDMSLHQLADHPYANVARAKNGAFFAPHAGSFHPYGHLRPKYPEFPGRSFGFENQGTGLSSSAHSPYHAARATIPGQHHVIPTRNVGSPIPGPLPSPGFSFGAADSSSLPSPSERDSPDSLSGMPQFAYPRREEFDPEDDATSASSFSRFGSIASESSNTSAYYSDVGSCVAESVYDSDGRRASCGSAPFLDLLSGLDVSGQAARGEPNAGSYSSQKDLGSSVDNEMRRPDESDQATSTYPSPASTASPGGSPHVQDGNSSLPISRSSELAYALQNSEALDGGKDQYPDVSNSPREDGGVLDTVPYFYDGIPSNESDPAYPQSSSSSSSSSSLSLPMMEFTEKFQFDGEITHVSAPGYQTIPYVPVEGGHYTTEGTFCQPENQRQDGRLHGMEFTPSSEYSSYNPDTSVVALESFNPYA